RMARKSNFLFVRMWPRAVFELVEKNKLLVKSVDELNKPGVYILYRGEEPHYVGKATNLFDRLHDHANKMTDRYYAHWDHFSAFAFKRRSQRSAKKAAEIEGILIAALPSCRNSSTPRWRKLRIPLALRKGLREARSPSQKAMAAAAARF